MCYFTKPVSGAGTNRHRRLGQEPCDDCKQASRAYYLTVDRVRDRRPAMLWSRYRLREHEYEAILNRQHGGCAICEQPFPDATATRVDHDHSCRHPGKGLFSCAACVRGILCTRCNVSLSILDNRELLVRAVRYLGDEAVAEILRETRLW